MDPPYPLLYQTGGVAQGALPELIGKHGQAAGKQVGLPQPGNLPAVVQGLAKLPFVACLGSGQVVRVGEGVAAVLRVQTRLGKAAALSYFDCMPISAER